jgi:hypothetical protein
MNSWPTCWFTDNSVANAAQLPLAGPVGDGFGDDFGDDTADVGLDEVAGSLVDVDELPGRALAVPLAAPVGLPAGNCPHPTSEMITAPANQAALV